MSLLFDPKCENCFFWSGRRVKGCVKAHCDLHNGCRYRDETCEQFSPSYSVARKS